MAARPGSGADDRRNHSPVHREGGRDADFRGSCCHRRRNRMRTVRHPRDDSRGSAGEMHAPDVRAKLSAIRTGRSLHPNTIAALLEAAQRPKSEDWKRGQSERSTRMWQNREAYGLPARHKWTDEENALLGTDSDAKIAKILGLKLHEVFDQRRRLGIPRPVRHWTEAECKLLGTASDVEIARQTGRTEHSVRHKRDELGVPSLRTEWTEEELALLGTASDPAIARKIGCKTSAVVQHKAACNLEFPAPSATGPRKMTPGWARTPTARSPRHWVEPRWRSRFGGRNLAFVPIATSRENEKGPRGRDRDRGLSLPARPSRMEAWAK